MNLAYLHLITNHFPIIGIFFAIGLVAAGLWWHSDDIKRFSLWFFVFLGLITALTYFTGEPAEDFVEHRPGFSETSIEAHEDAGKLALLGVELIAALSLLALLLPKKALEQRPWFFPLLLFISIVTTGIISRTAYLGGQIRHSEFSRGDSA
jgi:uncharacterized membrane protein